MKELGYSEKYSLNPNHLKETDSWQALLQEQIPDELITKTMKGLITHKQWRARDAGLDKALRTKGKYAPDKHQIITKRPVDEIERDLAETLSEALELVSGKR